MDNQNFIYTALTWDTAFFGYKVGRLEGKIGSAQDVFTAEKLLHDNHSVCTYYSTTEAIDTENLLGATMHWTMADRKIVFLKTIQNSVQIYNQIRPYSKETADLIKLGDLAIQSGIYSRFNIDERIGKNQFEALYREWMKNSLDRKIAREVLIYWVDNNPAGFVSLGQKQDRGDIGIIAVDHQFRGKGIGKELMKAAEKWFADNGYSQLQVVTQEDNKPACSLYERMGYKIESKSYIYHIWDN